MSSSGHSIMSSSMLLATSSVKTEEPWRERLFPNHEWVLLLALGLECTIFGITGNNFLSMPMAAGFTLLIGLLGGALNALLIARWNLPPLIVTLGTYSLVRGIAEGLTRGIENYFGFPQSFLFWGQGYVGGVFPTQLFILIPAVICMAWLVHRTAFGRTLYAIGYSQEGTR